MKNDAEPALRRRTAVLGKVSVHVFHDDKRPVRDLADGDGQPAERHQVGRESEPFHHDKCDERGDDERNRHDDGAADMAQEEKENEDDQYDPFDQRISHRMNGGIHQLNAIIKRNQLGSCRQDIALLQILHLALDRLDHLPSIAASKHEDCSDHDLPLAIEHHRAVTNSVADADFGDVPHEHRRAAGFLHDDGLNVAHGLDQPDSPDDRAFGMALQHVAADVGVVVHHRIVDLVERQVELAQLGRIDQNLILLHKSAHPVHIDDARHALDQRTKDPVLEGTLISQLFLNNVGIGRRRMRPFEVIVIHLP